MIKDPSDLPWIRSMIQRSIKDPEDLGLVKLVLN